MFSCFALHAPQGKLLSAPAPCGAIDNENRKIRDIWQLFFYQIWTTQFIENELVTIQGRFCPHSGQWQMAISAVFEAVLARHESCECGVKYANVYLFGKGDGQRT
jgi:hypothetical protein